MLLLEPIDPLEPVDRIEFEETIANGTSIIPIGWQEFSIHFKARKVRELELLHKMVTNNITGDSLASF